MSWIAKIMGGIFGTMIGGPVSGLLSAGIMHSMDREIDGYARVFRRQKSETWRRHWDDVLFSAEFLLAGHLARAGGLHPEEADAAFSALAGRRALSQGERTHAFALFRDGLRADFPLTEIVNDVRREIHRTDVMADGLFAALLYFNRFVDAPGDARHRALLDIARRFGIYQADLDALERIFADYRRQQRTWSAPSIDITAAYATLGVAPYATQSAVRRAYRFQMSRHHPDKIAHEHPSEERLAEATARTDRIRKAYDAVRRAHNW